MADPLIGDWDGRTGLNSPPWPESEHLVQRDPREVPALESRLQAWHICQAAETHTYSLKQIPELTLAHPLLALLSFGASHLSGGFLCHQPMDTPGRRSLTGVGKWLPPERHVSSGCSQPWLSPGGRWQSGQQQSHRAPNLFLELCVPVAAHR